MRRRSPLAVGGLLALLVAACGASPDQESFAAGWDQGAAMSVPRSELPAVVINGLVFAPGGYATEGVRFSGTAALEVYDPAADEWTTSSDLPGRRHHVMAGAVDGILYVVGGFDEEPRPETWKYDPSRDAWMAMAPLPVGLGAGAAVSLNGSLFVVGGVPGGSETYRYDPSSDTWERRADLAQPREHLAAVVSGGEIWAIGGRWSGVGELATVEIYNPETDRWRPGPTLQQARAGHGASVWNDQIVAAGGEVFSGGGAVTLDTVETVRPADPASSWEPLTTLPVPLHGVPMVTVDGALLVVGGSKEAGRIDNEGIVFRFSG